MPKILASLLLTFLSCQITAQDSLLIKLAPQLVQLKQRAISDILSASINEKQVTDVAATMKSDGSWSDIDYTDKTRGGWPVYEHLIRLNNMAILYKREGSKWTSNQALTSKIMLALDFWLQNDLICPNWWYPQIGVPKILGPIMLLMEDKLTVSEKEAGIKILNRAKIGMTGQNKVWLSGNVIYRSLLTGEVEPVKAAVASIVSEIIVSESEGIQPDYSFHQHGTQQQFGNYGASYADDMLKWANMFQQTPFQLDSSKTVILRNYLLQGMRWIIWSNKMDISACGRQLEPNSPAKKAQGMQNVFSKMPVIDSAYTSEYAAAVTNFEGNKHFWKSDMTVHRRKKFYTSVKMSSKRVGGSESCNDENIQGYHLGDGATYFYQSGEEYTNIFPLWDWKKIPGTTTFHDTASLPMLPCSGYNIQSDFVGGVSDGTNGISTMAYTRDGLVAQKSWFFFEDAIVCLGAGIHTNKNEPVTTSINQSLLHGNVIVNQAGKTKNLQLGEHDLPNVSWVLHDNWGYYFPEKPAVEISNKQKTGSWNLVTKRMPATEVNADLFAIDINHGNKPDSARYAYYVFPHADVSNISARGKHINLISNSANLQVAENQSMTGLVFVKPGEASTERFGKVSVNEACVLMLTQKNGATYISIADPTHLLTKIAISLSGKKTSKTQTSEYDSKKVMTHFSIQLPTGFEAGKTIEFQVR